MTRPAQLCRVAADAVLNLLYPAACEGCGAAVEARRSLCWECRSDLPLLRTPFCRLCGNPVAGAIDHAYTCSLCSRNKPHFEMARAAARHDGLVQYMLQAFKYHHALWLNGDLVDLLEGAHAFHYAGRTADLVVPVPLHPAKKRQRGYNQAELLARGLARRLDRPCRCHALRRVRPTPTQTHLTAAQRLANVRGAFQCPARRWVQQQNILLVDDVMTTGSTVDECARVLCRTGAARVDVLTVARR